MKIIQSLFILLLFTWSRPTFAYTYAEYKADSALLAQARKAYAQKEYKNALTTYRKTRCFPDLSVLDKIKITVCYGQLHDEAGVARTLQSMEVRYFINGAGAAETYDIFMAALPPRYATLKKAQKAKLLKAEAALAQTEDFRYLRHQHCIDQAVRGNVYHDSLDHYTGLSATEKFKVIRRGAVDFYRFVKAKGWPGYAVAAQYAEILATHDLDHLEEYLALSIAAAEKSEGDWSAVENFSGKIQSMKSFDKRPPPTQTDTLKQAFFGDDCRFRAERAKPIADSLIAHVAGSKFIAIEVAFDSSFSEIRNFSGSVDADMCPRYAVGSFSIWLNKLFEENPVLKPYRTLGSPNRAYYYYKDILKKYNQPVIMIIKYYK